MAREDIEIKGEVIAELEDIQDPRRGVSLLDALMIERVEVDSGEVTIVLIFEDDRPKEERWAIENEVHDALEELDEITDINILSMTRSVIDAEKGVSNAEPAEPAAPAAPAKPKSDGGSEELGGLSVYSGGGCGSGTVAEVQLSVAAPVAVRQTPVAAPAAPALPEVVATDGQVVLTIEAYTQLIQAQREAQLRPSVAEHNALQIKHQVLQEKVRSLQDVVRSLLGGLEGALSE